MTTRHSVIGLVLDGRYRLDALIAQGGFGAVYRGTHLESGCDVAIKVLQPSYSMRSVIGARFMREGQLLARLRHPNTVSIYDLGICGERMYIAMELLRGENLYERLDRSGPFGWTQAIAIAQGVCAALAEAHALGIVHRDLKPGNIHLEPWGGGPELVKVFDFGVAKLLKGSTLAAADSDELTHGGQVLGTLEYMAPEQILAETVDHRADIYALGVLLYEMLTGRRPFDVGGNTAMLLLQMAQNAPNRPSLIVRYAHGSVARELDRIVLRCLAKEADDRYQSVGELAGALRALARHAAPANMPERTAKTRWPAGTVAPVEQSIGDADSEDPTARIAIGRPGPAASRHLRSSTIPATAGRSSH